MNRAALRLVTLCAVAMLTEASASAHAALSFYSAGVNAASVAVVDVNDGLGTKKSFSIESPLAFLSESSDFEICEVIPIDALQIDGQVHRMSGGELNAMQPDQPQRAILTSDGSAPHRPITGAWLPVSCRKRPDVASMWLLCLGITIIAASCIKPYRRFR